MERNYVTVTLYFRCITHFIVHTAEKNHFSILSQLLISRWHITACIICDPSVSHVTSVATAAVDRHRYRIFIGFFRCDCRYSWLSHGCWGRCRSSRQRQRRHGRWRSAVQRARAVLLLVPTVSRTTRRYTLENPRGWTAAILKMYKVPFFHCLQTFHWSRRHLYDDIQYHSEPNHQWQFYICENSRCQTVAILKTKNGVRYLLQNCEGSSLKSIFLLVPTVSRLRGGCSLHHRHRRRRLSSFSGYPILYPNRH